MCFSKMLIKLVSNNISTANMYFFCYSDLDFLDMGILSCYLPIWG